MWVRRVRELRLAQGWSQEDLGRRVGCTKQHISELENGRANPSVALLRRLAQVFRVSETELLTDSVPDPAAARVAR